MSSNAFPNQNVQLTLSAPKKYTIVLHEVYVFNVLLLNQNPYICFVVRMANNRTMTY